MSTGAPFLAEELGKSPSVLVGIGSFLALLVARRMTLPAMVAVLILSMVAGEIVVVGNSEVGMGVSSVAEEL